MPIASGTHLGPYEILSAIGAGGMGEVYRAQDGRLDRLVAIKVLPTDRDVDEDVKRRFLDEARAASALNHPNIVTIYDIGTDQGIDYMAMELVAGKPLDELIPRQGLSLRELLRYAIQIAEGLSRAHGVGLIHRDLKPANVMVTPDGVVKILDFGLARRMPADEAGSMVTRPQSVRGLVVGTAAYMSPEQAEARAVDARSDIFSFGVMLFEMATGQRPFAGDSQAAMLASVLREEPRPPGDLRPDLPHDLARIITRCLRKEPDRRAQSMADLRVALMDLKDDSDSGRLSAPPRAPLTASRRSRLAPVVVVAALLLATVAIGWRALSVASNVAPPAEPAMLTSYTGNESQPAFSPDGNQVAFLWDGEQQDTLELYVKLVGSGAPLRLTTDARREFSPAWSPDGRNIAFLRGLSTDTFAVLLISPLGGVERKVGQFYNRVLFGQPLGSVRWASDSRSLFVSGAEKPNDSGRILRVSIDTGEVTTLAKVEDVSEGYVEVEPSPDGGTLALLRFHGAASIDLLSLSKQFEARAIRKLDLPNMDIARLAWAPDGRDLIVSLRANIPLPLYRIPIAGGTPQPLTWSGAGASQPAVAAGARRMAFVRSVRDTNIWQVALDQLGRGEPALQKLASSSFREVFPQYSPDGKRLSFHSNRGGSVQIWTSDADGSRAVQLTSMDPFATTGSAHWSPDGQSIVFDSNAGSYTHIYVIPSDGGRPRALTSGATQDYDASWSPDGREVYYTSNRSGAKEIWRIAEAGGDPQQITHAGADAAALSPDGAWLYYTKGDGEGGLWRMPITGGAEARLADNVFRYNFAIGKNGVYWMPAAGPDRSSSIRYLDLTTGVAKELLKLERPVDLGLAISPDGRRLLFTEIDYLGQDLMMVDNFR